MNMCDCEKQVRLLIEYHQQIAANCKIYGRGTELALEEMTILALEKLISSNRVKKIIKCGKCNTSLGIYVRTLMKKRKVKCPECKGLGVINKATPVFVGIYLTAYHSETYRCLHCDGKGIIFV